MPPLVVGLLILLALVLAGRWFATTPPASVIRSVKWSIAVLLAGAMVLLILSGRLAYALAALAAMTPWVARGLYLHSLYRGLHNAWNRMRGGQPASGQVSEVVSRFLRMTLDHDSGTLSGVVLEGPHQGRALADLSFAEVMAVWGLCRGDADSLRLLESWLDRAHPDWRERAAADDTAPAAGSAAMSRAEAYAVLGLEPGAGAEDVKQAYRKLMARLHPDHGGSSWLAAKLNEARNLLLHS